METSHKIIIGDSRKISELDNGSVHLVVTSPPYWQLKDYGTVDQIGFNDTYEEYINHLNLVWQQCHRVLSNGCRLCVNIGDQFARSVYYGRYKVIPIRTEIIKFCETIGFDYMGAVIWQKVTTTNTTGGATVMGSFPYPRNGILKLDYEFILLFKKPGKPSPVSAAVKEHSKLTTKEWNTYFSGHWKFSGVKQDKHLAMFPTELPKRLIKMFTFVGDTVLDPFLGSGTSCLVAKELQRNSVGYEINEEFLRTIKTRMGEEQLFSDAHVSFINQRESQVDFQQAIDKLPYKFQDPLQFERKVDPKKLQFGSKIDEHGKTQYTYYTVASIISPTHLTLNDSTRIKLIGLKEHESLNDTAVECLKEKLKGQKVFVKLDDQQGTYAGALPCYLYLKNKTFINAYLIKQGVVRVDADEDFRMKERFLKYQEEMM